MKRLLATLLLPGLLMIFSVSFVSMNCYAAGQSSSQGSYLSKPSLLSIDQIPNRAFTSYSGYQKNNDAYDLSLFYKFAGGDIGVMVGNHREAAELPKLLPFAPRYFQYFQDTYVAGTFYRTMLGPLGIQAEALMGSSKGKPYEAAGSFPGWNNREAQAMALHLDARMDLGPAYVGSRILYSAGNTGTSGKRKDAVSSYPDKWAIGFENLNAFSSILLNDNYSDYLMTWDKATGVKSNPDSVWLYQIYGGYAPTEKIDLLARLHYAETDKTPIGKSKSYGAELDIQGTYKISDNLTYNIGAAYLWKGDYFKNDKSADTANAYYLTHWLNLNF